jgi:hypothetical protein
MIGVFAAIAFIIAASFIVQEATVSGFNASKLQKSDTKTKQNDNSEQSNYNQQQNIPFELPFPLRLFGSPCYLFVISI